MSLHVSTQDPASVRCPQWPLQAVQHPKRRAGKAHVKVRQRGGFCGRPQGWQIHSTSAACAEVSSGHWSEVSTASTDEGSSQGDHQGAAADQSEEERAAEILDLLPASFFLLSVLMYKQELMFVFYYFRRRWFVYMTLSTSVMWE